MHAVHARSADPDAVPLLLLHGWPSTVADFLGVLPALTERFHVVAPSLPGFGFSGPTLETGWDLDRHADTLLELMTRCGYGRFVVQGGDWGGLIGPHVARRAPDRVALVHVNALVTAIDWTSGDPTAGLSPDERARVSALGAMWRERQGYAAIQSTRPQTLAYALADSPVGLLAWDLEWFVDYDPASTTQTPVDPLAILTDVTITWFTGTAGSSARLYKEARAGVRGRAAVLRRPDGRRVLPRGPRDPRRSPSAATGSCAGRRYDRGGHFAVAAGPGSAGRGPGRGVRGAGSGRTPWETRIHSERDRECDRSVIGNPQVQPTTVPRGSTDGTTHPTRARHDRDRGKPRLIVTMRAVNPRPPLPATTTDVVMTLPAPPPARGVLGPTPGVPPGPGHRADRPARGGRDGASDAPGGVSRPRPRPSRPASPGPSGGRGRWGSRRAARSRLDPDPGAATGRGRRPALALGAPGATGVSRLSAPGPGARSSGSCRWTSSGARRTRCASAP